MKETTNDERPNRMPRKRTPICPIPKIRITLLLFYSRPLFFFLTVILYNAHVGNSSLPDSRFLLITTENPPTSDVPLTTINIIEPNIMKV